jgi:hypothetical protein
MCVPNFFPKITSETSVLSHTVPSFKIRRVKYGAGILCHLWGPLNTQHFQDMGGRYWLPFTNCNETPPFSMAGPAIRSIFLYSTSFQNSGFSLKLPIVKKQEAFTLLSLVHTRNFKGNFSLRNSHKTLSWYS